MFLMSGVELDILSHVQHARAHPNILYHTQGKSCHTQRAGAQRRILCHAQHEHGDNKYDFHTLLPSWPILALSTTPTHSKTILRVYTPFYLINFLDLISNPQYLSKIPKSFNLGFGKGEWIKYKQEKIKVRVGKHSP